MALRLGYRLLRKLPPETAHNIGLKLLPLTPYRINYSDDCFNVVTKFGRLRNPVGLAAGFDKYGESVRALAKLGFGYIVAGTVTRSFRKGSPKPRLVRRESEQALVNAMGFPNPGLEKFLENIAKNLPHDVPVVVSVADENPENLLECYTAVQRVAAAVEVNISSPNTPQLRHYFEPTVFQNTAEMLAAEKNKPTYLKIPPQASQSDREAVNRVVKVWYEHGFEGVTAVNALLVDEPRVAVGRGGLSGRPLLPYLLTCIKDVRTLVDDGFEVHAVGGISTGSDVFEAFRCGANTVQIYTALVYRGPTVVEDMLRELREIMKKHGLDSLEQIRTRR